ncbi:nickel transporter [Aeromonas hydrophila]|uniref:nickel transporter n=1 Tax=Aeromonas hydrophila TaxID=644 RepID=UPI0036DACDFB
MQELAKIIQEAISNSGVDKDLSQELVQKLTKELQEAVTLNSLKAKLSVLFEYEKNYLQLVKEFKEEIKFASGIQEDLRKERAKFFSETLKEVSSTLTESQVDDDVASQWLKELVNSYTKSLDLSGGLIEEHTSDMIGKIRDKAKEQKNNIEIQESNAQ